MWESKAAVKEQARSTMAAVCGTVSNDDLQPFVPDMIEAIEDRDKLRETIDALGSTTFVQPFDAAALAIATPILERGFNRTGQGETSTQRKCCVITENLAKLVKGPAEVADFKRVLQPLLARGLASISDPEVRDRFTRAHETLARVSVEEEEGEEGEDGGGEGESKAGGGGGGGGGGGTLAGLKAVPFDVARKMLRKILKKEEAAALETRNHREGLAPATDLVAAVATDLAAFPTFMRRIWTATLYQILEVLVPPAPAPPAAGGQGGKGQGRQGQGQGKGKSKGKGKGKGKGREESKGGDDDNDDDDDDVDGGQGSATARIFAALLAQVAAAAGAKVNEPLLDEERDKEEDDEDDSLPDLCDLEFSLAYGTNILLNNARLHLKKGLKYGIIASKSAGKTTMMRAINNGMVEGFPDPKEVRTVFVENDIQGEQLRMNTVEYVLDTVGDDIEVTEAQVRTMLTEIGYTPEMQAGLITSLSGGWKMKLALGRATLQNADIMLMDEPTNHLDVINVQWVVDYINSETLKETTCMIVSHDTAFLDKTVTQIIHFDNLKLKNYKGNVTDFVARFPWAKSYFELGSTTIKFTFPAPAQLMGAKGRPVKRGTPIMSMKDCAFTYPGAAKPQLTGVSVMLSMASRVAIVGANGAGKSTMIKLLTGEFEPDSGIVKKNPNMRFAYVAQHAFHHIEQHLDKTPNQYIRWRYETGDDKEALVKETMVVTEEEKQAMAKPFEYSWKDEATEKTMKEKRVIEKIVSRKTDKKKYIYEIKYKDKPMSFNTWHEKEFLFDHGWKKMVDALDARLLALEGMMQRPLTSANVEKHLENVGLEPEYGSHSRIRDLSGGQKVKVVLAACTWACPHVIILDEPTNYLDRDSLGALATAIEEFEGGVCLITHHKEFAEHTTRESWVVANNKCDVQGDPEWEKYAMEDHTMDAPDEYTDASGNTHKVKKVMNIAEMSKKDVKQYKKVIQNKIKQGRELDEQEQEMADAWDIAWD
eukprot:g5959.t1